MQEFDADEQQLDWMHRPIFTWNGSIKDPIVSNANNILLNTSECFPPALVSLAMDYVIKGYGTGTTIYDLFVRKIGALFLGGANPRDFQREASRHTLRSVFKNPFQSNVEVKDYIVSDKILFTGLKERSFPMFDVHDICHHAGQIQLFGDFFVRLSSLATDDIFDHKENTRKKLLLRLVLLVTLEYSVVTAEGGFQSFGCLNWQSPRKSPLALGVHQGKDFKLNEYPFGAIEMNQWSTIRAMASIYRRVIEAEDVLSTKLTWMQAMGYAIDESWLSIIKPFQKYDYSNVYIDTAFMAKIKAPSSPEELFANCTALIEEEF